MAPLDQRDNVDRPESIWIVLAVVMVLITFLISSLICNCCGEGKTEEEHVHVHKTVTAVTENRLPSDGTPATNTESPSNAVSSPDDLGAATAKTPASSDMVKYGIDRGSVSQADVRQVSETKSVDVGCEIAATTGNHHRSGSLPTPKPIPQKQSPADIRKASAKSTQPSSKLRTKQGNYFMGGNCLSTTRTDMNAPVIIPATAKHTATVIFMHGLGDTGHGWAPVFQMIRSPHVKYICPTAPTIPVTLNMGMQMPSWFDIRGLNINADEDEQGIKKATTAVHSWLEEEIKTGIPSDRIVLGGFSQGGGLALYSALTYDKPLAGIVGLSCWLPLHKQVPGSHQANKNVPILQCHGDADPLVIAQVGQLTAKMLQTFNSNHTMKIYPGMGHSSCDQEIQDIKQFLELRLPPN